MWTAESIVLTEAQISRLEAVVREAQPFEGCALLLGSVEGGRAVVTDILPADNRERSTVTFQIDPEFVFEAYQMADREGKELVAVFHSHPALPRPSPIDIQYMQINPVVWLILSTTTRVLEAHQLRDEAIHAVDILRRSDDP